jgi:hypothetical protein
MQVEIEIDPAILIDLRDQSEQIDPLDISSIKAHLAFDNDPGL